MSFIAAVLILNLDTADAFIAFSNLLNKPCQMAFFRVDHGLVSTPRVCARGAPTRSRGCPVGLCVRWEGARLPSPARGQSKWHHRRRRVIWALCRFSKASGRTFRKCLETYALRTRAEGPLKKLARGAGRLHARGGLVGRCLGRRSLPGPGGPSRASP